jgi:hypothetical protein
MPDEKPAPFHIADLLAASAAVLWRNLASFCALALLSSVPLLLVEWLMPSTETAAAATPPPLAMAWLVLALACAAVVLSTCAAAVVAAKTAADRRNTRLSLIAAIKAVWRVGPALLALLVAIFLLALLGLLAAFVLSTLILAVTGDAGVPLYDIPVPLLFALAGYLAVVFSVIIPVITIERQGLAASLRRSARLTHGARWRIAGLIGVLAVLVFAAGTLPFGFVVVALGLNAARGPAFNIVSYLFPAPFIALFWVAIALLYDRFQKRTEPVAE